MTKHRVTRRLLAVALSVLLMLGCVAPAVAATYESGTYTGTIPVNVKGDIGEGQSVTVTSTAPIMKCSGSKNVTATFTGTPKKSWSRTETSGTGTTDSYGLSAVLTPGTWEGTATFSCAERWLRLSN